MQRDDVRRTQLAENLRFYGEMRFKQLTLLMAVMTLVGAAVLQGDHRALTERITLHTAGASFALLFTAVVWVMEVRAVLYWLAHAAMVPELWPSPRKGWSVLSATNAVLGLYASLYVFWLCCARSWNLEPWLLVAFSALGLVLVGFSLWAYLARGIERAAGPSGPDRPVIGGPRPSELAKLARWYKSGDQEVLAQGYGKMLVRQRFVNPLTKTPEDFILFGQPDWAVILPITEDNQVVAVWQYKQGCDGLVLELPAGTADRVDEPPVALARRELAEETGYEAQVVDVLGPAQYMSTRNSWTRFHVFLATGCRKTSTPLRNASEEIIQELIPLERWVALCLEEIVEPSAVVATFRALPRLGVSVLPPG